MSMAPSYRLFHPSVMDAILVFITRTNGLKTGSTYLKKEKLLVKMTSGK